MTWPRTRYWLPAAIGILLAAAALVADSRFRESVERSRPALPTVDLTNLFFDYSPIEVTVRSAGMRAPWGTTVYELQSNHQMWRRMHWEDWNAVPPALREPSLDRLLRHDQRKLNAPAVWDRMTVFDWDDTPQPIRTVAYRRMVSYWAGFYRIGEKHGLPAPLIAETLAAIVMSESWFDHRATSSNADGGVDIGLGQASPYARQRLRELQARGVVDVSFEEDEYFHPWKATRFVALWMLLMLDEAGGNLDVAVRAYNRGISSANDSLGDDYHAAVQRRLTRYIRNGDAPPAWDYLWRRARALIRSTAGSPSR